ncbi:MAG: hypothetical protein M5U28_41660 [Sandaracinaceae bacterium]|nr:hypothetical protein [Sandaracinaceae bacterium]
MSRRRARGPREGRGGPHPRPRPSRNLSPRGRRAIRCGASSSRRGPSEDGRRGGRARARLGRRRARQDAEERARAEFERGLALLDEGRHGEAIGAFERAIEARETAPAVYNLGLARRAAGHYRAAIVAFARFVEILGDREPELRRGAEEIAAELRRELATVRLHMRGDPEIVLVDSEVVDPSLELVLDPGRHVFEARRSGYRPLRIERTLSSGARATITLDASEHPLPARVVLELSPRAARVAVDGGRPRAARSLSLAPGTHTLVASAPGHVPLRRALALAPGESARLSLSLEAVAEDPWTAWWTWTLIGGGAALVAVAVVIGVVASAPPPIQYHGGTTDTVLFSLRSP